MAGDNNACLIVTLVILGIIVVGLVLLAVFWNKGGCNGRSPASPPSMAMLGAGAGMGSAGMPTGQSALYGMSGVQMGTATGGPCGTLATPEPAPYWPYGKSTGAAYDSSYPNSADQSSLYPQGCTSDAAKGAYELNLDPLMPASWRASAAGCPQSREDADSSQWTKYAPTPEAFQRYITAAGSARLAMNTRSPLGRQVGVGLNWRPPLPVPVGTDVIPWQDSGFRQDLVFQETGQYPVSTAC